MVFPSMFHVECEILYMSDLYSARTENVTKKITLYRIAQTEIIGTKTQSPCQCEKGEMD
jgi:hypothetical protein